MSSPRTQIAAAMTQLIAVREDLMVDTGRATRPPDRGQTPELDADGMPVTPAGAVVYEGVCTIADPSSALIGNRTVTDDAGVPNKRILRLPAGSPSLRPGDVWEVLTSLLAPALVGRTFLVVGEEERSYTTHRRYVIRGNSWLSPPV